MSKGYAIVVKMIISVLVLWLSGASIGFPDNAGRWCAAQQSGEAAARYIRYGFTLRNTTNRLIAQAELWTYAPVQHTATQQRIHLDASLPFEELTDEAGNSILHFTIHHLPPYAAKIITIQTDLLLFELRCRKSLGRPRRFYRFFYKCCMCTNCGEKIKGATWSLRLTRGGFASGCLSIYIGDDLFVVLPLGSPLLPGANLLLTI
ncbi:MAG: hypothetical protein RBT80_00775 [Candidatus Vecturithrix sp.]|jgi:hypothetical protein|nr:hypothetical protein [Candidatus Vecturithrix sp.]